MQQSVEKEAISYAWTLWPDGDQKRSIIRHAFWLINRKFTGFRARKKKTLRSHRNGSSHKSQRRHIIKRSKPV